MAFDIRRAAVTSISPSADTEGGRTTWRNCACAPTPRGDLGRPGQGAGVAKGPVPRLSEPFYRGAAPAPGTGAGLGLAITRRAIQLHDGSILAANAANGGLTITISIPLATIRQDSIGVWTPPTNCTGPAGGTRGVAGARGAAPPPAPPPRPPARHRRDPPAASA